MNHRESGAECACVCVWGNIEIKLGSAREWKKEKKFEWQRKSI